MDSDFYIANEAKSNHTNSKLEESGDLLRSIQTDKKITNRTIDLKKKRQKTKEITQTRINELNQSTYNAIYLHFGYLCQHLHLFNIHFFLYTLHDLSCLVSTYKFVPSCYWTEETEKLNHWIYTEYTAHTLYNVIMLCIYNC